MLDLRRAAVFALALLFGLAAQADDEPVSLDSVDTGETRSLDSVDTGSTRSLDSVDTGETVDQDALDVGDTTSLDDADTGRTVDADTLDTGTTESLGEAEAPPEAPPSLPRPLPPIADDSLRADAQAAHAELVAAERRVAAANAAYSEMRAHDYPRGDAAAAIAREYAAANVAYEQANARYREILEQVDPASLGD
jgi:hypothetical protein